MSEVNIRQFSFDEASILTRENDHEAKNPISKIRQRTRDSRKLR